MLSFEIAKISGRFKGIGIAFSDIIQIYIEKFKLLILGYLKLLKVKFFFVYKILPDFPYKDYAIIAVALLILTLIIFLIVTAVSSLFRVDHLKKGEKLLKKGKYDKAKKHFLRIKAYSKTAYCCLKLTKIKEAAEYFLKAKFFPANIVCNLLN